MIEEGGSPDTVVPGSDRAAQDALIRALADAGYRRSPAWRGLGLAPEEPLERFSRFLARHFYYERIVAFFKYSRALARLTGRRPEQVVTGEGFEALLPSLVLGSRRSAAGVAALARSWVAGPGQPAIGYLEDLLAYEEAMMVVEAGPRNWSGGPESAGEGNAPAVVEGTRILELSHNLPAILPLILQEWSEPPSAPRSPTRLLVARTAGGRVSVVAIDPGLAAPLELADGRLSVKELAGLTGAGEEALHASLKSLAEVGAIRFHAGS